MYDQVGLRIGVLCFLHPYFNCVLYSCTCFVQLHDLVPVYNLNVYGVNNVMNAYGYLNHCMYDECFALCVLGSFLTFTFHFICMV
jgi:hypothetical protein